MELEIRKRNNIIIFDISRDIRRPTKADVVSLHQLVKEQLENGKRNFLFNFEKVDFIDSYGVGELLASFTSTHNLGGKLKLIKISQKIRFLFEVTGIIRVLDVFDDEEAAIKSFS